MHRCMGTWMWMCRCLGAQVHRFSTDAWMCGYSMDAARMHHGCMNVDAQRHGAWVQHGCSTDVVWMHGSMGTAVEMADQPQEVLTRKP